MVAHILKKDIRLLRGWIGLIALLQAVNAALSATLGPHGLSSFEWPLNLIPLLGAMFLAAAVVQQDALTDIRLDWRVRPIRPRDLLVAKLLFVLLMVHGPMFLADLSVGLILGNPVRDSALAALTRGIAIFCFFSLPSVVLATLTRNVGITLAAWSAILLSTYAIQAAMSFGLSWAEGQGIVIESLPRDSGLAWIQTGATALIVLLAAGAMLPLRYFRRNTAGVIGLVVAAVVLSAAVPLVIGSPAFAIQQLLSAEPGRASGISVAFDPAPKPWDSGWKVRPHDDNVPVELPLKISGLSRDVILLQDKVIVRLVTSEGERLLTRQLRDSVQFRLNDFDPAAKQVQTLQSIDVPAELYHRIKNQPVRVEIDYALTLLELDATYTLPLSDAPQRVSDSMQCTASRVIGSRVEMRCTSLGKSRFCIQALIEQQLEESHRTRFYVSCNPSYAPVHMSVFPSLVKPVTSSGAIYEHRKGWGTLYASSASSDRRPLTENTDTRNSSSRQESDPVRSYILETYAPRVHFERKLVIPAVRLGELSS